jgi:hypothetical protein
MVYQLSFNQQRIRLIGFFVFPQIAEGPSSIDKAWTTILERFFNLNV